MLGLMLIVYFIYCVLVQERNGIIAIIANYIYMLLGMTKIILWQ